MALKNDTVRWSPPIGLATLAPRTPIRLLPSCRQTDRPPKRQPNQKKTKNNNNNNKKEHHQQKPLARYANRPLCNYRVFFLSLSLSLSLCISLYDGLLSSESKRISSKWFRPDFHRYRPFLPNPCACAITEFSGFFFSAYCSLESRCIFQRSDIIKSISIQALGSRHYLSVLFLFFFFFKFRLGRSRWRRPGFYRISLAFLRQWRCGFSVAFFHGPFLIFLHSTRFVDWKSMTPCNPIVIDFIPSQIRGLSRKPTGYQSLCLFFFFFPKHRKISVANFISENRFGPEMLFSRLVNVWSSRLGMD